MGHIHLPTEEEIRTYLLRVPVATKDYGMIGIVPWGTQTHLLREILRGLDQDIHQFVVLKSRQVGASTLLLLLATLWLQRFPGLQGVTIADCDDNKQYFRDLFLGMVEQLQGAEDEQPTIEQGGSRSTDLRTRNLVQITWRNGSRLLLQHAGRQTWQRVGVGRGLSFCHGTEVGLWSKGMSALTYLRSAFSEVNPAALYVFEGTARGKNWYFDLWESAQKAKSIKPIFLAWWMRWENRIHAYQKNLWETYHRPLSGREVELERLVWQRDAVRLSPEQWAWRRWYIAEKAGGSKRLGDQEQPTVWEDAFSASQERPFLDGVAAERIANSVQEPSAAYVYRWGATMEETRPDPAGDRTPMLRVWQVPDSRPTVIAAVPAFSAIAEDPSWVVSVWATELHEDRLEQVAEFHTERNIGLQPFAWVCLHLAGAYGTAHKSFILETSGLGIGVLAEIRRIVNTGWGTTRTPGFLDVLGSVRHYIYRKPDSLGLRGAYQWKSTPENHATILQRFRDNLHRGVTLMRSAELARELSRFEGAGLSFTPAGESPRGHRAYAGALALESYVSQLYPSLRKYRTRGVEADSVQGRVVRGFFATLGRR